MIIDGKAIATSIREEIKTQVDALPGRKPGLAVVQVGTDPASSVYVNLKKKACEEVGIVSLSHELPGTASEKELLDLVDQLNADPHCDGILVQLPLPKHMNPNKVIHRILPEKDVDGFHPVNMGKLLIGDSDTLVPCTPLGVKVLMERCDIDPSGKHVVIVGRSNIVGKPLAALLCQRESGANATVTIAHSATADLTGLCRSADILVTAIGRPRFVTADMVGDQAVVIDVGINRIEDSSRRSGFRLVGDVDYEAVKDHCKAITPVPGGVGPMTIAMLLQNTLQSYASRN